MNKRGTKLFSFIEIFILIVSIIAFSNLIHASSPNPVANGGADSQFYYYKTTTGIIKTNSNNKPLEFIPNDKNSNRFNFNPDATMAKIYGDEKYFGTVTSGRLSNPNTGSIEGSPVNDYSFETNKINDNVYEVDGDHYLRDKDGFWTEKSSGAELTTGMAESLGLPITQQKEKSGVWKSISEGFGKLDVLTSLQHAGTMLAFAHVATTIAGFDSDQTTAVDAAVFAGVIAGESIYKITGSKGWGTFGGVLTAAVTLYYLYDDEKKIIHTFNCGVWHAPTGGSNCEKCTENPLLPCSEYQCKSLGAACEIVNAGTSEVECIHQNADDAKPPQIKPWDDSLLNDDYDYTPDNTVAPGDNGVIVEYKGGCIPAFEQFSFGVVLDEPARCKVGYTREMTYENMTYNFGESSLYRWNHTQTMSLPSPSSLEAQNITLENGGEFDIYVKCQDANGNENLNDFFFRYCVDDSEDVTPPVIDTVSPLNNVPIAYDTKTMNVDVYINEPSSCKWSHSSQPYKDMENTFSCASSSTTFNSKRLYKCSGTLDGLKNAPTANKFYFACEDEQGNPNQIYEYTVLGTEPLYIDSVEPDNGTLVKDASETIKVTLKVKTSDGFNKGESICSYSSTGASGRYLDFKDTDSYEHTHELWLPQGTYNYYIKCTDAGGNSDITSINFEVDSDTESPNIARVYHYSDRMYLTTEEEGECVYSTNDCKYEFDTGLPFTSSSDKKEHSINWILDKTYYIKCRDMYENAPAGNECSVIIRPFNYEK